MFEELLNTKVKIACLDGDKIKTYHGILIGEDPTMFKIRFYNGRVIGLGKAICRIFPEQEETKLF